MIDLLKGYGRAYGLDRHEAAGELSRWRNSFPLIKGDANHLHFKKGTFHLITLFDVLYHQHIFNDEVRPFK
jgi:hypothetical protein